MHLKNLVYLVHVDSTNSPPSPLVDLRGLFMNPPSPPSGPHGLRMTPKTNQIIFLLDVAETIAIAFQEKNG